MSKYNQITLLRQDDATVTPVSQQVSSQNGRYTPKQLRYMNRVRQNKQTNTPASKRNYKYVSYDSVQMTLKFIGICENK